MCCFCETILGRFFPLFLLVEVVSLLVVEVFLKNIADVRYSSVVPMYNSANKKFEIRNSGFRSSKSRNSFPFLKTFRRLRFFLLGTDIFLVNLSTHTILFITYIFAVSNLRNRTYCFITSERI